MNSLIWVTPPGLVAEILSSVEVTIQIQARDTKNPNGVLMFSVISGSLPLGLILDDSGRITGVPDYSHSSNNQIVDSEFTFTVRTRTTDLRVLDGQFTIRVVNTIGTGLSWITPGGNLGTVPAGEFYNLPLQAKSTQNSTITYRMISGELPGGMRVISTGELQGVPEILNAIKVDQSITYEFSVRASDNQHKISDRTFQITITNITGPVIQPASENLGTILDGSFFSHQLSVPEPNPNTKITWSLVSGNLPDGVSLDSTGLISGYVHPLQLVGDFGPKGFDGASQTDGVITAQQPYSSSPYDFNQLNQNKSYDFTIQAYDGANYAAQHYVLTVITRRGLTADSSNTLNNLNVPVNTLTEYYPILLDAAKTLPVARQDSYYAYKFQGYDFDNDNLTYQLVDTVGTFDAYVLNADAGFDFTGFDSANPKNAATINLPGLFLDAQSGWLYGRVFPQTAALTNYVFGITVSKKKSDRILSSSPIFFTLPVLGDINNVISWVTDSNLGSINNGDVSELSVIAKNAESQSLTYALVDRPGIPCRLPQGLILLPTGDISGRVTFEHFGIDNGSTTFDGGKLTIDQRYDFWVQAQTADGAAQNSQMFTIHLNIIHDQPHNNLYLRALPKRDQRTIYDTIINDKTIFDPDVIYRATDPYFGVQSQLRMLFLTGLNARDLTLYEQAMIHNHYLKNYDIGNVKTAAVLDDSFNVKYEVVYLEILDPEENSTGQGPGLVLDLTSEITNPHISASGTSTKIFYPNTSNNMVARLQSGVGTQDQSTLPPWMTRNQPGPNGTFMPPLGYVKAVVLAYTKPGGAELIAHRLKNQIRNLDSIQFTADRYEIDNFYSKNFVFGQGYASGAETTFDAAFRNVGLIVATVTSAVSVPFDQINGRSLAYINARGGIDGRMDYASGDTIVFAKQENFLNSGPYDGWVYYTNLYLGDNTLTTAVEGYDSGSYDTYSVVPGYLEKIQGTSPVNRRGGVWKINIINNIVSLVFIQEVQTNERIRIVRGNTYASAILTYSNQHLIGGQSVPYYEVFKTSTTNITPPTTFNNNTTRFFSRRDQYYTPESRDKYLKFTQYGAAD